MFCLPKTAWPPTWPGFGFGLSTAADYLGLSESELQSQLESGKTLAEIAKALKIG